MPSLQSDWPGRNFSPGVRFIARISPDPSSLVRRGWACQTRIVQPIHDNHIIMIIMQALYIIYIYICAFNYLVIPPLLDRVFYSKIMSIYLKIKVDTLYNYSHCTASLEAMLYV